VSEARKNKIRSLEPPSEDNKISRQIICWNRMTQPNTAEYGRISPNKVAGAAIIALKSALLTAGHP